MSPYATLCGVNNFASRATPYADVRACFANGQARDYEIQFALDTGTFADQDAHGSVYDCYPSNLPEGSFADVER